jgi:hypothetical protein
MDSRASVFRTTWLSRSLNRSVASQSFAIRHSVADYLHHSSDRRIPFLFYYVALVCHTPRLELCLQLHKQHHVRRALRDLARAVPDKRSWNGKCTLGGRESYLWDHSADYRPLYELGDISAYLCFGLSVYCGRFYCIAVAVRAAWEGVIVDTQHFAAGRLVP